ncbi:hypothetical protein VNO78_13173 [Psophocarpus tetragonolobus]|uniref:Uncharacterized protein n=1 Tax=Psophocarpus tetragonolobus TaxID=3891 RepID=A0AAN9SNW0_PSOTE
MGLSSFPCIYLLYYSTSYRADSTQGSRKERASRQPRQHKLKLRNTEEKRIQLNLSLSSSKKRIKGQRPMEDFSLPWIHLKSTEMTSSTRARKGNGLRAASSHTTHIESWSHL